MATGLNNLPRCSTCLNTSTRPRISFDQEGRCNACQWVEEKKTLDWTSREKVLEKLLKESKSDSGFDCIVPCSGGKDGSYVSHMLRSKYDINPLTVTLRPPLESKIGKKNFYNFLKAGFANIHITPNAVMLQKLNKEGFIHKGFPYYGWLMAIMTAPMRVAANFGIKLLFYGEDGEVEYGGSTETKDIATYDVSYQKRVYLEGGQDKVFDKIQGDSSELYFFNFPDDNDLEGMKLTHWSYYESWDPYRNYLVAKEHCGLEENLDSNEGTFTNFAQNDQLFYVLHAYMMYLKFGFGRATQDAGIEIRRGAMTREQGVNLVRLYDGSYPEEFIPQYLEYYQMSLEEFDFVIDRHVNTDLFAKEGKRWIPKFDVE